ncbi:hypothetical protein [uncultured Erythrobacter sp.]|uniref:hypothetical protein n=1 Tax=uncultured Erythrobacter sp. TaxID=263913 RepID=UPI002633FF6A|nr:hypothetical protein [uncultured Erythrobacter sp.]
MRGIAGLAAAALAIGAPLHAQDGEAFEPAFSAEDDLDCAIYVGALMAEMEEAMTPDNRAGLTSAFTYFTGRYEAQRGLDLVTAFTERYPVYAQRNPVEIQQTCAVRMRAFGVRLQEAGQALTRIQPAPAAPAAPAQSETAPTE